MTTAMDPGKLNERVTLQSRTVTTDGHGQQTIAWTDVAQVWARVRPLRASERFAAAAMQQEATVEVTIRARSDVAATWRLLWQGLPHDITGVLPIGRTHTQLLCLQGVKDGR